MGSTFAARRAGSQHAMVPLKLASNQRNSGLRLSKGRTGLESSYEPIQPGKSPVAEAIDE